MGWRGTPFGISRISPHQCPPPSIRHRDEDIVSPRRAPQNAARGPCYAVAPLESYEQVHLSGKLDGASDALLHDAWWPLHICLLLFG